MKYVTVKQTKPYWQKMATFVNKQAQKVTDKLAFERQLLTAEETGEEEENVPLKCSPMMKKT